MDLAAALSPCKSPASSSKGSLPHYFTLIEAEIELPRVEKLLRSLIELKQVYEDSDSEMSGMTRRIALLGGTIAPRGAFLSFRKRKEDAAKGLKDALTSLQAIGCQLKDLETGLIDFPTLYRGKEVYLCWRLGEPGIAFWHHIEDGFQGRKSIDADFLTNHTGDLRQ